MTTTNTLVSLEEVDKLIDSIPMPVIWRASYIRKLLKLPAIDPFSTIDAMIEELSISLDKDDNLTLGKIAISSYIGILEELKQRLSNPT